MSALTSLRDAVATAYAAIVEEDATPRGQVPIDGALEALLAPGARTRVSGARAELLDLFGLVAQRVVSEGPVLVITSSEPAAAIARRWLHARARVVRSSCVSREGWAQLSEAAGSMAALDVSFLENAGAVAPTCRRWRAVLDLRSDDARAWPADAMEEDAAVLSTSPMSTRSNRWWCATLERNVDTVRVLRTRREAEERATELYYEGASGFLWELETELS